MAISTAPAVEPAMMERKGLGLLAVVCFSWEDGDCVDMRGGAVVDMIVVSDACRLGSSVEKAYSGFAIAILHSSRRGNGRIKVDIRKARSDIEIAKG
jgi:hypothetical protein